MFGKKGVTAEQVRDALRVVIDPDLHRDIVTLGFVKDIAIQGADVAVTIELTTPACPVKDRLRREAEAAVQGLPGVGAVSITMTAQVRRGPGAPAEPAANPIPGVRNTIAVTSGKGGVGKSTVAANLAMALAQSGAATGLLDADVYGPSVPTMFGVPAEEKPYVNERQLIEPIEREGLKLMSIGFLVERDAAMIMRGPMLAKYVQDALARVDWGELDYLVIDLPPGTGDVQLTLSQTIPLTGAVVVTTPQQVALADVRRAVTMCEKLNVPILGIVENMSDPVGPDGQRQPMFGHGGGRAAAAEWGCYFLGEVHLDPRVPVSGDAGLPLVAAQPEAPGAARFVELAGALASRLSVLHLASEGQAATPTLRIVD
ncbi:MAG: Mrp/NBP35 family ATP-binding protein [Fimbriimonadaceae bacterium]|nr:Mrp/NBP35 family ATP-binding protein [Fimbriimonadaceae bacterium]